MYLARFCRLSCRKTTSLQPVAHGVVILNISVGPCFDMTALISQVRVQLARLANRLLDLDTPIAWLRFRSAFVPYQYLCGRFAVRQEPVLHLILLRSGL